MDKAEKKRIDQEQWCKELIIRLGKYNEYKARLEVLEIMLERSNVPASKMVASYGDNRGTGLGVVTQMEVEHREVKYELQLLEAALRSLTEKQRAIIKAKYIEGLKDWHILDILIPKHFNEYISKRTYHGIKAQALETLGKTLGMIPKLH